MSNTLVPEQAPVAAASVTPSRIVPALVNAMPVWIECPDWCTIDHVAQNMRHLVDIWHGSDTVSLYEPDDGNPVLVARIGSDPYSTKHERRVPFVAIDDGNDSVNLTPQQAEVFADSLEVFAARVRDLVRSVAVTRAANRADAE